MNLFINVYKNKFIIYPKVVNNNIVLFIQVIGGFLFFFWVADLVYEARFIFRPCVPTKRFFRISENPRKLFFLFIYRYMLVG